jgi:hypothetical protein
MLRQVEPMLSPLSIILEANSRRETGGVAVQRILTLITDKLGQKQKQGNEYHHQEKFSRACAVPGKQGKGDVIGCTPSDNLSHDAVSKMHTGRRDVT